MNKSHLRQVVIISSVYSEPLLFIYFYLLLLFSSGNFESVDSDFKSAYVRKVPPPMTIQKKGYYTWKKEV
jgi:hypothetical protein